jgi:AcrR family transcriptional regulator
VNPGRRPGLRAEQRAEREARVLETARALIAEAGYEGVTMRDLARRSRVSVPTLYKLFGDKDALLVRAVGAQLSEFLETADRGRAARGVERLLAVPSRAARAMLRAPRYSRAVVSVFVGPGRIGHVLETVSAAIAAELEKALARMAEEGALVPWAEPRAVAERLATHHVMVCMQWAGAQIPSRALEATLVYGLCLTAGGAARGEAARRLAARAREVQDAARGAPPVPDATARRARG